MAKKRKGGGKKNRRKAQAKGQGVSSPGAPDAPDIIARAEELAAAGRSEDAMGLLAEEAQANPENGRALESLGRMHMNRREFEQAAAAYEKLVALDREDPKNINAWGTALTLAGRAEEAGLAMKRAVDLAPANPLYLSNLAKLYMLMGRSHMAVTYLERALACAPESERWKHQEALNQCQAMAAESKAEPRQMSVGDGETPPPEQADAQGNAPAQPTRQAPRVAPPAKTAEPLNILFVQEAPCIRNYKLAVALGQRGHKVSLAYSKAKLSQMYQGLSDDVYHQCIQITGHRHLWDLTADYDLVHCHNEPDVLSVAALGGDAPVVHDTHDLISLRADGDPNLAFFEGLANRAAHGRLYTTPYQQAEAEKLYGVKGPCHVHYNYVSAGDLPTRMLAKDSTADGAVHIVYEGGIGTNGHRDFSRLFMDLAQAGVHVHIYPTGYNQEIARTFGGLDTIHYNRPLSPTQIMEEMTRFDFGIIPFNLELGNKRFLDSTIANKLFEYLAAGLPVLASPLQSYVDYFAANPVGMTFRDAADILANLDRLAETARGVDFSNQVFTHEGEVERLEGFYREVIEQYRGAGAAVADQQAQALPQAGALERSLADLGWAEVETGTPPAH